MEHHFDPNLENHGEDSDKVKKRVPWSCFVAGTPQSESNFKVKTTTRSLSSQVMEYYEKYSGNSNLNQYFSLPVSSVEPEFDNYCSHPSFESTRQKNQCGCQNCSRGGDCLKSSIPRERRRWARPPLIGQSSNNSSPSRYLGSLADSISVAPKQSTSESEKMLEEEEEEEEERQEQEQEDKNSNCENFSNMSERKSSPASSIASHKPLEWDSGADVGYSNTLPRYKTNGKMLSTIERMALATGCLAATRLDPEGTTTECDGSTQVPAVPVIMKFHGTTIRPDANSTPLLEPTGGFDSDIEITPIVKTISLGSKVEQDDMGIVVCPLAPTSRNNKSCVGSRANFSILPCCNKYTSEFVRADLQNCHLLLKRCNSLNAFGDLPSQLGVQRSRSEFNLREKDLAGKSCLPLISNSTTSIATIVNKPTTCDKVIQTSIDRRARESIGIQVSVLKEENQASSLTRDKNTLRSQSISKNRDDAKLGVDRWEKTLGQSKTTDVKVDRVLSSFSSTSSSPSSSSSASASASASSSPSSSSRIDGKVCASGSEMSINGFASPRSEDRGNIAGKANSFEYFPGDLYENVPNRILGRSLSDSTFPRTLSSINDKLWGDSDSLVKDLEKSVNILRNLVDANKCNQEVKRRLIHHVVKRLVTAKYAEDGIKHNLQDNVPWNPDNARKKMYTAEILQALGKKDGSSDSSNNWESRGEDDIEKKLMNNVQDSIREKMAVDSTSGTSDNKFARYTDRAGLDGRRARMGLRTDDCRRHGQYTLDDDQSVECFLPQHLNENSQSLGLSCSKTNYKFKTSPSNGTTSTADSTNEILNDDKTRPILFSSKEKVIDDYDRDKDNGKAIKIDWRIPATLSERRFELKKNYDHGELADSKLVSYVEREKKNQLDWINNEITHLYNLKKLLEQSRKPRKSATTTTPAPAARSKALFKKSKSNHLVHKTPMEDPKGRGDVGDVEHSFGATEKWTAKHYGGLDDAAWSSHCNLTLVDRSSTRNSDSSFIQRLGKKNSCSQTADDRVNAHSKTGAEIIYATRIKQNPRKFAHVGTQAPTLSPSSSGWQQFHDYWSDARTNTRYATCSCPKRLVGYEKIILSNVPPSSGRNDNTQNPSSNFCGFDEDNSFLPTRSNDDVDSDQRLKQQKDTKNRMNCSKLKVSSPETSSRPRCKIAIEQMRWKPDRVEIYDNLRGNVHVCSRGGQCRVEIQRKNKERRHNLLDYRPTEGGVRETRTSYLGSFQTCQQFSHEPEQREFQRRESSYRSHGPKENQWKEKEGMDLKKKELIRDTGQRPIPRKGVLPCPRCGVPFAVAPGCVEQGKARNFLSSCKCIEIYPKSIAYELSFVPPPGRTKKESAATADDCFCPKNPSTLKPLHSQKTSLGEYLAMNNPQFLGTAETRRQYVAQITHLRQLGGKGKSLQLLAMAVGSSGIPRPAKSNKSTNEKSAGYLRRTSDRGMGQLPRGRLFLGSNNHDSRRTKRRREQQRHHRQDKEEDTRRNQLRAKIYCRKLQQKVLKGQVSLSQSCRIISTNVLQ